MFETEDSKRCHNLSTLIKAENIPFYEALFLKFCSFTLRLLLTSDQPFLRMSRTVKVVSSEKKTHVGGGRMITGCGLEGGGAW